MTDQRPQSGRSREGVSWKAWKCPIEGHCVASVIYRQTLGRGLNLQAVEEARAIERQAANAHPPYCTWTCGCFGLLGSFPKMTSTRHRSSSFTSLVCHRPWGVYVLFDDNLIIICSSWIENHLFYSFSENFQTFSNLFVEFLFEAWGHFDSAIKKNSTSTGSFCYYSIHRRGGP